MGPVCGPRPKPNANGSLWMRVGSIEGKTIPGPKKVKGVSAFKYILRAGSITNCTERADVLKCDLSGDAEHPWRSTVEKDGRLTAGPGFLSSLFLWPPSYQVMVHSFNSRGHSQSVRSRCPRCCPAVWQGNSGALVRWSAPLNQSPGQGKK